MFACFEPGTAAAYASLDDLTKLAAQLCAAPLALISMVGESDQWFVSRLGTEVTGTPREFSFCAYAIEHAGEFFEIADTFEDPRFCANPLVTGAMGVRSYAGVPLTLQDGLRLGTLCVIDHQPRTLTGPQREALAMLARQAVAHFELRRALAEMATSRRALGAEVERRIALEDSQRASASLMRGTLDAMQENIAILNRSAEITHVNRSWQRFATANATPQQLTSTDVGADYLAVCARSAERGCEQARQVAEALQAAADGTLKPGFSLEYPCHSPDEQRWFSVQIGAFDEGEHRHVVVTHQNITQRYLAEHAVRKLNGVLEQRVAERTHELAEANQALRASESRFRSLFKNASVGMVQTGADGVINDVNEAYCAFSGSAAEQLLGTAIDGLAVVPQAAGRLRRLAAMMFAGSIPGFEFEFRHAVAGTTPLWARASVTAVRNVQSEAESALYLIQNVTRSKTAEYERDRFFELSVDMMVLMEADGTLRRSNPACTRVLGFSEGELLATNTFDLMHPDDRERGRLAFAEVSSGRAQPLLDLRVRTSSGEIRYTRWSSFPWLHENQMIAVGRDITSLRQAELQEHQSARQLRALASRLQRIREEERTSISREIHDELGQMLTALKMDLTLLRRDAAAPGWQPEPQRIVAELLAMDQLVDQTLKAVRRIARQLRPEALDALGLVPAVEWQAGEINSRAGPQCKVFAEGEWPELEADCNTALFRIVQESLTNVVRHADASSVRITFTQLNGRLNMSITDDGRGFDTAHTVDSPSLGLLGMRERATEIGAEFEVRSRPGDGTVISVQLAAAASDAPHPR